ncbi:macrolide family glycosyltransferase [Actinoplanes solisilvae]|uniref:macrolide family glycosyltransferase n=1 Tax=Actinoplanes solisilvae TaxID=2486853 RepID=UPI000FD84F69|nr:macrolide family glycosyltransferase [Actinoplanes solisilvae]
MSTVAFINIGMHGRINPTLPVVHELVRRGHTVSYHTSDGFRPQIEAAGATVHLYPGDDHTIPDPPTPAGLVAQLARTAVELLPPVLAELRDIGPDLIVHDSACPWGAAAAHALGVPAASSFTTFAYNERTLSPTRASWELVNAAISRPGLLGGYLKSRWELERRYHARGLPPVDLGNIRQPLNLVFTSREFQVGAEDFDESYKFVGPSIGLRPAVPFPFEQLRDPVLYASLGTVFDSDSRLLRAFALALADFGGSVVIATGNTEPAELGALPDNVIARRNVPQPEVLDRAAMFITHGGMNGANEALYAGVPMLVVPQGADQPLVAARVVELGAGLTINNEDVDAEVVRSLARRLLFEPRFRSAARTLMAAQRSAGGYRRATEELERVLRTGAVAEPARDVAEPVRD